MAGKWIRIEKDLINQDYIALVEQDKDTVTVHLAVACYAVASRQLGAPIATDHIRKTYRVDVWDNAIKNGVLEHLASVGKDGIQVAPKSNYQPL